MEEKKTKWGVLSTAKIGLTKVTPAIQKSSLCEVVAVASRNLESAENYANQLGIEKVYDSYQALLDDLNVEVVYNPLPNHMHVEWTIKAMSAGKHVLCEKPIAIDADQAKQLLEAKKAYPNVKVMEAFMYKFHPQWIKVKELIDNGAIGEVKNIQSFFSYYNVDPQNIRNNADMHGGALMDIGCYNVSFARYIFGKEPDRVMSLIDRDPIFKTDRITNGMMDFSDGKSSSFTCSTQLMPHQRCTVFGLEGYIEVEIPVNAPPNEVTRIWLVSKNGKEEIIFNKVDQYTLQAHAFATSVLNDTEPFISMEDSIGNMAVTDAVFESAKKGEWVNLK